MACKVENNVPFSSPDQAEMGREISWIQILPIVEGESPRIRARFIPILCMHCDRPPWVPVCPTGATYKSEATGIVAQIYPRCVGCRYCANACPYSIKSFNWFRPTWPKEMEPSLNRDVSVRPKGVVEKCTFCHHRLQKAREKAKAEGQGIKEGDYVPACVQACPSKAMYFGDLDDPESEVAALAQSHRAFRLQEDLGTEPRVYYLQEGEWHAGKKA